MNSSGRHLARSGSGELAASFGAKAIEVPRVVPLHRRRWARWLAIGIGWAAC